MRKVRGLIALVLSLGLAFFAARAVFWYLSKPQRPPAPVEAPVAEPVKPATFAEKIPAGMRVFNLRVNEVSGISRQLQGGDTVDVVAVGDIGGKTKGKVSRIVLQKVTVLKTGLDPAPDSKSGGRHDRDWTVSLLVTPEQGALLSAVTASAEVQLLARSPDDHSLAVVSDIAYTPETGRVGLQSAAGDLPGAIPPGMRAVTIEVRDTDGICGILRPGDRVDVIVTSPYSTFASGGDLTPGAEGRVTEFRMVSRVLLQNVAVLTTETILSGGPEISRPTKRVTVLVTPGDAEKLAVVSDATQKSILRLISRNAADDRRVTTGGQSLADLLTKRREYHRIDVLKGTQTTERTFYR
jgi:Flp pilus assembly protein CpaB